MSGWAFNAMKKLNAKFPLGPRVNAKIDRQSCSCRCNVTDWLANCRALKSYVVPHCADHIGVMLKLICEVRYSRAGCLMNGAPAVIRPIGTAPTGLVCCWRTHVSYWSGLPA